MTIYRSRIIHVRSSLFLEHHKTTFPGMCFGSFLILWVLQSLYRHNKSLHSCEGTCCQSLQSGSPSWAGKVSRQVPWRCLSPWLPLPLKGRPFPCLPGCRVTAWATGAAGPGREGAAPRPACPVSSCWNRLQVPGSKWTDIPKLFPAKLKLPAQMERKFPSWSGLYSAFLNINHAQIYFQVSHMVWIRSCFCAAHTKPSIDLLYTVLQKFCARIKL